MINKLLPTISLALLCFILHEQNLKVFSYNRSKKSDKKGPSAVYEALITGDKTGVPKSAVKTMKEFGLMHLLTPSGLHLGSFLLLFKFFPKLKFMISLALFVGSFSAPGLLALKRMLIFYLINFRLKNLKLSFFATFMVSLLIGNYAQSPMSFSFTFIFWGCIVFHEGGKWALAKKLFFMQAAVACLFNQEINLSAVFVNPALTAVFSLAFPVLLFLYPLDALRPLGLALVEIFVSLLESLNYLAFLNHPGEIAMLFCALKALKRKTAVAAILLVFSQGLNLEKSAGRKTPKIHYPLPAKAEFLKAKKRKIEFIDRSCKIDFEGFVLCKKKPSYLGGPHI